MSTCVVATCTNYYRKTKGGTVIYHRFPDCPDFCKTWILKCKRLDHFDKNYARMCSDHFTPSDYIDDMKNRLLGLPQKKILKPDAVPSINLPFQYYSDTVSRKSERIKKRSVLQRAKNRLENLSPKKGSVVPQEEKVDNITLEPTVVIKEEPLDYYPTPSTSAATDPTASEEFILPHEDSSSLTPNALVEPKFTLSVACLAPETNDSEQSTKKRKANNFKFITHVPSTNDLAASDEHDLGELSNPGSSKSKDQFDIFGEYIAAKLRNLDLVSCAYAQKAIGDIIFEAELGKYRNQTENAKS